MLRGKLSSVFRKQYVKYLSTVPSPNVVNELLEDQTISVSRKEEEILQSVDYFNVHKLFTVKDLFNARVHYGHKEVSLKQNMKPFVFGSRLDYVIFDLDITAYHLREALNFIAHIAFRDGIILFISKNPRVTLLVENTAKECNEFAVTREWRLGTFTDSDNYKSFMRLPDLCIFLNTIEDNGQEHLAVTEAAKLCIPTVGIVDSNCNPNLITYPVPGNDDSFSCFQLYCKLFKEAILRGKEERQKFLKELNPKTGKTENAKAVENNEKQSVNIINEKKNLKIYPNVQDNKAD